MGCQGRDSSTPTFPEDYPHLLQPLSLVVVVKEEEILYKRSKNPSFVELLPFTSENQWKGSTGVSLCVKDTRIASVFVRREDGLTVVDTRIGPSPLGVHLPEVNRGTVVEA